MSAPSNRSWLRSFLKPLMPVFREVLAMSLFVNILALAVPVFTLQVYDRVVAHAGISTLQGLVLGMLFVLAFDYVLRQSRSRIMQRVALRVDVVVGKQIFDKFMSLPMKTLEAKPGAHWQSLFRDVDIVRNTLSGASAILMADLPFAILFLGVIFVIAPAIAWVLLVLLPIFVFVAWRSAAAMSEANKDERETTQSRDSLIAEIIAGRTTIKALALDRAMRPIWEHKHAENIERAIVRGGKSDTFTNLGGTLTMLTTLCMTSIGAVAIIDQRLTMGGLIATNMLSGRLIGPLNQLVQQWRTYSNFRQAVDRLGQMFNEPSERTESEIKLDKPRGEISVEGATFAYTEGAAPVVDNVTLKIAQGGVNALVGRNGSGKTTLLKILQGLYLPTSGRVLLDGADISQFSRSELATWIGYVPQENVLFAGSVRDNISHRIPDATDDEIVRAAKAAGIHQFIIDLPDGYASEIGEAGQRLSGGQRQRISIARALVGEPPVLLLDEPSSSLDRQAEHDLRKTLEEIGKTCTVVIVTHSPILLSACRDLAALDRGRVALAGPASEILPRLFGAGARTTAQQQEAASALQSQKTPADTQEKESAPPAASGKQSAERAESRPDAETDAPAKRESEPRKSRSDDAAPTAQPRPVSAKPRPVKGGPRKTVEPSPLLQAISQPKSKKDEAEKPVAEPRGVAVKSAPTPKEPAQIPARPAAPPPGTKPVLQVAPAVRHDLPPADNDDDSTRPGPTQSASRPHLTVKQGGKKATGTNGMAPRQINRHIEDD